MRLLFGLYSSKTAIFDNPVSVEKHLIYVIICLQTNYVAGILMRMPYVAKIKGNQVKGGTQGQ